MGVAARVRKNQVEPAQVDFRTPCLRKNRVELAQVDFTSTNNLSKIELSRFKSKFRQVFLAVKSS